MRYLISAALLASAMPSLALAEPMTFNREPIERRERIGVEPNGECRGVR